MWMVMHVGEAVYSEYDQLRHVRLGVIDAGGRTVVAPREINALAAEGIVPGIPTERSKWVSPDFVARVCRDHAADAHRRYLAGTPGGHPLGDEVVDIEGERGLEEVRFRLLPPRPTRIFA
jgi:hypothetical protein